MSDTEWRKWDPNEHKRGRVPQCSRPGCRETPSETRYSTRTRMGEIKLIRHAFCAPHTLEEKEKEAEAETAST